MCNFCFYYMTQIYCNILNLGNHVASFWITFKKLQHIATLKCCFKSRPVHNVTRYWFLNPTMLCFTINYKTAQAIHHRPGKSESLQFRVLHLNYLQLPQPASLENNSFSCCDILKEKKNEKALKEEFGQRKLKTKLVEE